MNLTKIKAEHQPQTTIPENRLWCAVLARATADLKLTKNPHSDDFQKWFHDAAAWLTGNSEDNSFWHCVEILNLDDSQIQELRNRAIRALG